MSRSKPFQAHLFLSRAKPFHVIPPHVYSQSFDFVELRFYHRGLHSSREAAADARSSAGEDDRCAKWYGNAQSLRQLQHFRGGHCQLRGAALEGPAGERGGEQQNSSLAAHQPRETSSWYPILMEVCRLLRPISFHPSRSRDLERSAAALQFSGARGLSCCSPTSFSSARVSASFTQHTSTPVPLPRARQRKQRSKIRSGLPFCHKRSVRALMSLPQEQIEARDDREVKLPTARGANASSTTTISSASGAALEVGTALETRRSIRASRALVYGHASARPARGSVGGLAAASAAASAAPPSVAAGRAAPLASERVA